jgi:type I restriction modification DNA specificity protein
MSALPRSWAEVEIVEVLEPNENGRPFQQGWSPQCENFAAHEGQCQWGVLKTTAIQHGEFWAHENKALPASLEPRPHIEVKAGDVLMTCAGPRNRCGVACLVEHTPPRLMMSGKMYRFRPHPKALLPKYLAYLIQRRESQLAIDRMKTGISDSGLNLTHDRFAQLRVPVAPLPEQRRIVAKIEELFSELDASDESLTRARAQLKTYHQALLKAAFEGVNEYRKLPGLLAIPMSNGYSGKPVSAVTPWKVLSLSATTTGIFLANHFKYLDEARVDKMDVSGASRMIFWFKEEILQNMLAFQQYIREFIGDIYFLI